MREQPRLATSRPRHLEPFVTAVVALRAVATTQKTNPDRRDYSMNDSNQFLRKSPPVKARTTVNFTDPEQSSRLIQHVAEALNKKISNDEEITNTDIAKALHILLMVVGASEFQRSRKIQPAAIVPKVSLH